jgi:hypothetical protein
MANRLTIDKKTKKLLKELQKQRLVAIIESVRKQTLILRPFDQAIEQLTVHVGHHQTEKTYHPIRRWAKANFGVEI